MAFDEARPRLVPVPTPVDDGDEIPTHWSDERLLLYRTFRGHINNIRTDQFGQLTLVMGIEPESKADAFALTDFTGMVFTFDAYFRPRRKRPPSEDEPEPEPDDANSNEDG